MSSTRFYVIGNPVQVMIKPWLFQFPKDRKDVKNSDIFNSLKPRTDGKLFTVFTSLETAKRCATIKTRNDNQTVYDVSTEYRPVIAVSLSNEDKSHLIATPLDIYDGSQLRLFTTDAFETRSDNIQYVYSFYYRTGGEEVSVSLSEPLDLQETFKSDNKSSLSNRCSIL